MPPVIVRALHETARVVGPPWPAGRTVRAWDYKQKRALVIAFLHAECELCGAWLGELRGAAATLAEREAVALVVFADAPDARVVERVPANMVMGLDVNGRGIAAYLGKQALERAGLAKTGVFVTDRYGELYAAWESEHEAGARMGAGVGRVTDRPLQLPPVEEVLSWLAQIQIACEECYSPHWPAE